MKRIIFIFVCIVPTLLFAQKPEVEWQKSYGGSLDDFPRNIIQTSDGGYIAAGQTNSIDGDISNPMHGLDFWVVKMDNNGDLEWENCYGGYNSQTWAVVRETADGGFVIVGSSYTYTPNGNSMKVSVIKLFQNGTIDWQKTYGGSNTDVGWDIQQTDDLGFVIVGWTMSDDGDIFPNPNRGGYDVLILKLDLNGDFEWSKTYGGTQHDWGFSIQQTSDSGYIIAGHTASNNWDISGPHYGGGDDIWVLKLDNVGELEWENNYGGNGNDRGTSVKETSNGYYIIAGQTTSTNQDISQPLGGGDAWVLLLNPSNGAIIWEKTYGGSLGDSAFDIEETVDGGFIVIGGTNSDEFSLSCKPVNNDLWIFKIKGNGDLVWNTILGGTDVDYGYSIAQTLDGGYIALARTYSDDGDVLSNPSDPGNFCFWIVKLGPEPEYDYWPRTYGSNICNNGSERTMEDIVVDDQGNVYTSGYIYIEDMSFEESLFLAEGNKVLMKHDSDGKLVWINYLAANNFTGHGSVLKLVGDKLVLLTSVPKSANVTSVSSSSMGIYVFDLEGNSLLSSPYELGPSGYLPPYSNFAGSSNRMRVFEDATGINIMIAATFHNGYSNGFFDNGDYTLTGPSTAIFKFNLEIDDSARPGLIYIDYKTHSLIEHSNSNTRVNIYDIEYSAFYNKLFVSGEVINGTATITPNIIRPNQITNQYFGVAFSISQQSVALSQLNLFGSNRVGLLAYDDDYQHLYVERGGDGIEIFQNDFTGSTQQVYNAPTNGHAEHFYFHEPENMLFVVYNFYNPANSSIAKVDRFGTQWEISLDPTIWPWAIAKGDNNYIFVTGSYYGDGYLGSFPIYQYHHTNSMDVFIGRIQDDNNNPIFYSTEVNPVMDITLKPDLLNIYPNPSNKSINVETSKSQIINVDIYSPNGKLMLSNNNVYNKNSTFDIQSLENGFYLIRVETTEGILTGKLIKN